MNKNITIWNKHDKLRPIMLSKNKMEWRHEEFHRNKKELKYGSKIAI